MTEQSPKAKLQRMLDPIQLPKRLVPAGLDRVNTYKTFMEEIDRLTSGRRTKAAFKIGKGLVIAERGSEYYGEGDSYGGGIHAKTPRSSLEIQVPAKIEDSNLSLVQSVVFCGWSKQSAYLAAVVVQEELTKVVK